VGVKLFDHEDGLIADDFAIERGEWLQPGRLKKFGKTVDAHGGQTQLFPLREQLIDGVLRELPAVFQCDHQVSVSEDRGW